MATQNIFNLTDTWNNVATTFTAVKMNVTDTTSAAGSLLFDLQIASVSVFNVSKTGAVQVSARSAIRSPSDGVFTITNAANTDFFRLQFGGTTSSFPCLKRSGATLQVRLADDSALANFESAAVTTTDVIRSEARLHAHYATAIPAGGTTGAGVRVSSATNFGVFFGSGAPTLSAAKGSLYLRSDGSGINDRMYVNTDGSTTWTAVVTIS